MKQQERAQHIQVQQRAQLLSIPEPLFNISIGLDYLHNRVIQYFYYFLNLRLKVDGSGISCASETSGSSSGEGIGIIFTFPLASS